MKLSISRICLLLLCSCLGDLYDYELCIKNSRSHKITQVSKGKFATEVLQVDIMSTKSHCSIGKGDDEYKPSTSFEYIRILDENDTEIYNLRELEIDERFQKKDELSFEWEIK